MIHRLGAELKGRPLTWRYKMQSMLLTLSAASEPAACDVSLKMLAWNLWPTCHYPPYSCVCVRVRLGNWSTFHRYLLVYRPESQRMFISSELVAWRLQIWVNPTAYTLSPCVQVGTHIWEACSQCVCVPSILKFVQVCAKASSCRWRCMRGLTCPWVYLHGKQGNLYFRCSRWQSSRLLE